MTRLLAWPVGLVAFALLLLLPGCAKESTAPSDNPPEPVGEATIGSDGGTLAGGDLEMEVPAGAFASEVSLALYEEDTVSPFGAGSGGAVYRLAGLPESWSAPLLLRVRRPGGAASPSLMIGEETFAPTLGEVAQGWRPATTSADTAWCSCELPPPEDGGKGARGIAQTAPDLHVLLLFNRGVFYTAGGHFELSFDPLQVSLANVEQLGQYLEEAYQVYEGMGFVMAGRWLFPIRAPLLDMGSEVYGAFYPSWTGGNACWLEFNTRFLAQAAEMRVTAGHEVFHFYQYFYDPRPSLFKSSSGGPVYWLDEASAVWAERKFSTDPGYVSAARANNQFTPLLGAVAGAGPDAQSHGYGMSSFLKRVADTQGEGFLLQAYQDVLTGALPFAALSSHFVSPVVLWWGSYLRELLTGGLYGDVTSAQVRDRRTSYVQIDDAADTLATLPSFYPDLSGKIYWVRLRYAEIGEQAALRCRTDGGACSIAAFRYRDGAPLEFVGQQLDSLTVPGLRALTDAGWDLMILVANHLNAPPTYDGSTQVTLTLRVGAPFDPSVFESGSLHLRYAATWAVRGVVPQQGLLITTRAGHFSGNVFEAAWDSVNTATGVRESGSFYATLNLETLALADWSVQSRWDSPEPNTYNLYQAHGTAIPLVSRTDQALEYQALGTSACGGIAAITVVQVADGEPTDELLSFDCNAESYVTLDLRDDR